MKSLLAILLGKTIAVVTRGLKFGGGSAAPGLYALKLDPQIVKKLASKIPINVVITGTNGKTTTARIIAHFAKNAGLKVIRNHTGSNLERGIASALIHNSSFINHKSCDLGIWELDEAAFNIVAPKINPDLVVFLNVFRDQLDRYGEVDSVVKGWVETLKRLPKKTIVLVNGDDANTLRLSKSFKGRIQKFGVKDYKIVGEGIEKKREKENLDFEAKNVKLKGLSGSRFQLTINNELLTINLPIPGIYHIYDALAAIACAKFIFTDPLTHRPTDLQILSDSLKSFQPAFGRVEKLDFGYIFLIKNPAGATQVFQTIAPQIKKEDRLLLALNDNLADGTDVSWIWDAGFEKLLTPSLRDHKVAKQSIYVSGTRAYDLTVRLKYAGFDPKNITIEPKLDQALKQARKGLKGTLYILPTYTAMLEVQSILTKSGIKKNYWEENG